MQTEQTAIKCGRLSNPRPSDEHYTPPVYLERVRRVLDGGIDLDPCAPTDPNARTVPATRHWTREDDGLSQPWEGDRVFVNPPYSDLKSWSEKLAYELQRGQPSQVIALVPAYTDTGWWNLLMEQRPIICLHRGRIRFHRGTHAARFSSAWLYFGVNQDRFFFEFRNLGSIVQEVGRETFGGE
jgi:hypothetical protein